MPWSMNNRNPPAPSHGAVVGGRWHAFVIVLFSRHLRVEWRAWTYGVLVDRIGLDRVDFHLKMNGRRGQCQISKPMPEKLSTDARRRLNLTCLSARGHVSSTFEKPRICLGGPKHIMVRDVMRAATMGTVRTTAGSILKRGKRRIAVSNPSSDALKMCK